MFDHIILTDYLSFNVNWEVSQLCSI